MTEYVFAKTPAGVRVRLLPQAFWAISQAPVMCIQPPILAHACAITNCNYLELEGTRTAESLLRLLQAVVEIPHQVVASLEPHVDVPRKPDGSAFP